MALDEPASIGFGFGRRIDFFSIALILADR